MYRPTPNKSLHLVSVETCSSVPTAYESEIIRLLRKDASVVQGPYQRSTHADLRVFRSSPDLIDFDEVIPTIVLSDHKPTDLPLSSIVLPVQTAPSSVAQVARCLLANRSASSRENRHAAALEAHASWTWAAVAKAPIMIEGLTKPVEWLRYAAEVLEREIQGLSVEVVVAKDDDKYYVLMESGESILWQEAKMVDIAVARADALLPQVTCSTLIAHLHEPRRDFLIPFPGHDGQAGWILIAFESDLEATLRRNLLAEIALYLQSAIRQRASVAESEAWRHAIEAGLDSIDSAIVILDKNDRTLLANQSSRKISNGLSPWLGSRSPEFNRALCSARKGTAVTIEAGEFTFTVAPWGSLQNGCVLHALAERPGVTGQTLKLRDWFDRFLIKASFLGLKINEPSEELPWHSVLIGADPELVATELTRSGFKQDIIVGKSDNGAGSLLSFDQEGSPLEEEQESPPPAGILTEKGSIGRRLSVAFRREQIFERIDQ